MLGIGLLFTPRVLGAPGGTLGGPPGAPVQHYGWGIGLAVILCMAGITVITMTLIRIDNRRHPARGLSPEQVVSYRGTGEDPTSPEVLYRLIIERLARIRRTLQGSPPSEVEVEMCALGYQSCADDAITLLRIIDEESLESGPLRRLRLGRIRRKTLTALSGVRETLPAQILRCSRGDSLNGELS